MSMAHLVSRRMFVSASSAIAAGFVSGVPLLARSKQQRRGAEPGEQLTAGMIDFHVHTAPDTAERTVTAVEAARTALDRGLRSIVLKGTAFETVTRAAAAKPKSGVSRHSAAWCSTGQVEESILLLSKRW